MFHDVMPTREHGIQRTVPGGNSPSEKDVRHEVEWSPSETLFREFLLKNTHVPFFIGLADGSILQFNPSFEKLAGIQDQSNPFNWKTALSFNREARDFIREDRLDKPSSMLETMLVRSDGTSIWVRAIFNRILDPARKQVLYFVSLTDINKFKEQESKVVLRAMHDGLTGLPNRGLLIERLKKAMAQGKKDANIISSVISVDLNEFKRINDRWGHDAGDELLIETAGRLRKAVRDCDTVARTGGDEFFILLESIGSPENAHVIIRRIMEVFEEPFVLLEHEIRLTTRMGVILNTIAYSHFRDVIKDAERAMQRSKGSEKSTCVFHNRLLQTTADQERFRQELLDGLLRQEIFLVYQPIVDLQNYRLMGFEALVRWKHPLYGLIFPEDMIPAVEEVGLIETLGAWIFDKAARDLTSWNGHLSPEERLRVHINISDKQARDNGLSSQLEKTVRETGISRTELCLEFLRKSFTGNGEDREKSSWITCLGANLVIDDLKMNLLHLNFFFNLSLIPFDMVKVEKSVIDYIQQNRNLQESLRTFINIFSSLGIKVVAKGVESLEQIKVLTRLKCNYAQGFIFSKPLDREGVDQLFFTGVERPLLVLKPQGECDLPPSELNLA
jgi:diguanylate cyclase (GGDEF)-like protein/PAS domain S-box-containing protein